MPNIPAARVSITLDGQPLEWMSCVRIDEALQQEDPPEPPPTKEHWHSPWITWLRKMLRVAWGGRRSYLEKQLRLRKRRRNHK